MLFPPPLSTFQFQFQSLEHPLPSRKSSPGSLPRSIAKWYRKQDGEIVFFFSLLSFFPSGNDFLSFAPHSHPLLDSLISTPCMRRGSRRDLWELLRVIKRKKRRRKGGAKVVLLSIACEASVFSDRFFFFFVLSHKKRKLFSFQKKKKHAQSHTILLYQLGKSPNSRTFADYPSPPNAADGCIASFEESLKQKNATKTQISYAASDLHAWLDSLPQAGALVFDSKLQAYVPFDKAWLKQQCLLRLQELARAAAARQQQQQAQGGGGRRR